MTPTKPKRKQRESEIQQACVRWFDCQHPKYRLNLFSVPNEGARSKANGARMKAQGRRKGVADIFFSVPKFFPISFNEKIKLPVHGCYIEVKIPGEKQSPEQIAFQKAVESQGYWYRIVTSTDEFIKLIEGYLK